MIMIITKCNHWNYIEEIIFVCCQKTLFHYDNTYMSDEHIFDKKIMKIRTCILLTVHI